MVGLLSVVGIAALVGWVGTSAFASSPRASSTAPTSTQQDAYPGVSAACGEAYEPNRVEVDGDVNKPVSLSVDQIRALPGQETLNISYLNHLGAVKSYSETGPTLWNVLSIAAGGLNVPPPTPNQYAGPSPQTALYVVVIATDGYETVLSEGEIDPGFGNAPILLGYAQDGVPLSQVPYSPTENEGPAQLVVPGDTHGGRYANQICRIKVVDGAL
jgi:DMSO/TMAO reductase YedYZ molybdopterin-dependent catalytic subunit